MDSERLSSLSQTNRLFWLGRYLERVQNALQETKTIFDAETDGREADYATYCTSLGIPADYANTAAFVRDYYFDADNPNSIATALGYAYDNAIVLRETLSSESLAYVQMAVSAMELASQSRGPGVELQWVLDDIMAFRGSFEENMSDEAMRNVLKSGSSLERLDMYLRMGKDMALCKREFERLVNRLYKTHLDPDKETLNKLVDIFLDEPQTIPSRGSLLAMLGTLFSTQ